MHNERANEMWKYIGKHVSFTGKKVLDLGCGYGDLLNKALEAGASYVLGVDRDFEVAAIAASNLAEYGHTYKSYGIVIDDIERIVSEYDKAYSDYDIVVCNSVLTYLNDVRAALRWMRYSAETTIIESQYDGDGPGFQFIQNDSQMKAFLRDNGGWRHIKRIGATDVMIRPASRTIWKCYG